MPRQPAVKRWRTLLPAGALAVAAVLAVTARSWPLLCVLAAVLACLPPLLAFERDARVGERTLALTAVMSVLTALSRVVFTPVPGFKPVTALVIVTALYFGANTGFATGALAALLSGLMGMGLGPWTPLQMLSWGLIGLLAGWLARPLLRRRWLLCLFAAIAGALFSLLMDVYTALWAADIVGVGVSSRLYAAAVATSLPVMGLYALSNVVFLLAFGLPLGKIFARIKRKYGWD